MKSAPVSLPTWPTIVVLQDSLAAAAAWFAPCTGVWDDTNRAGHSLEMQDSQSTYLVMRRLTRHLSQSLV